MTESSVKTTARMISFVLPVYNEHANLAELHERITAVMADQPDAYELVFVDDGSTDDSFDVLSALREQDDRIRVVQFRRNFGKAAAYSAGFEGARGDVIITMDTDLQDDPAEIPLFVKKIDEGFDMVVGWKHKGKGSLEKSLPSRFFNAVVRRLTRIPLHDFNCPFKAYRRQVLQEIHVYGELHRYIPVLASSRGFTLAEIKISNLPRKHGKSHYGLERYIRGMLDLLTVIFITRFLKRPMHFLAVGGILACTLGLGILAFFTGAHILFRAGVLTHVTWNIHDRPALSLGILLIIVGIQFFSMGLLAELLVMGSKVKQADSSYSIKRTLGD
jgi:glycosyltransferase involved in cell wall biosynthesis